MTNREEFLTALSQAPARPLTDDYSIPGLGSGPFSVAALWAVQERTRELLGDDSIAESIREGREFAFGPFDD